MNIKANNSNKLELVRKKNLRINPKFEECDSTEFVESANQIDQIVSIEDSRII